MRMIRWMSAVSLKERQPSTELRRCLDVEANGDVVFVSMAEQHYSSFKVGDKFAA